MNEKHMGGLPSDGRGLFEYKTKYPAEVIKWQWKEAIYIFVLMIISLIIMLLNFLNYFHIWLSIEPERSLITTKIIYCMSAGLLGGSTLSMKMLFRAVSSGHWNEDRVFWRVFSPFVGIPFALVISAIFSDNIIVGDTFTCMIFGFFSGYFSDEAAAKMYDVALVLFARGPNNGHGSDSKNAT